MTLKNLTKKNEDLKIAMDIYKLCIEVYVKTNQKIFFSHSAPLFISIVHEDKRMSIYLPDLNNKEIKRNVCQTPKGVKDYLNTILNENKPKTK